MEYVQFKDLQLSRFCMGGCPMGGYGWGETQESDFIEAIHEALDRGVNFFDTANTYGFGQSEETLAKGLAGRRHEVVIQSKFGVRVMQDMVGRKTIYDNSPDYIDIYTIHYRDKETPLEDVVSTLESLREEGKVRHFGISNIHRDSMQEFLPFRELFATCQDEYSLACRKNEADLNMIRTELGALPMTWGSLGQGILTGKYDASVSFGDNDRRKRDIYVNFHGEKLKKNLEIVEAMKPIAAAHGKSCAATAIRFILDHLPDSIVTAGVKNIGQMKSNLEGLDWHLTEEELKVLDDISREG